MGGAACRSFLLLLLLDTNLRKFTFILNANRELLLINVHVCAAGLESVDHYPILVAVTGILVRILVDGHRQG